MTTAAIIHAAEATIDPSCPTVPSNRRRGRGSRGTFRGVVRDRIGALQSRTLGLAAHRDQVVIKLMSKHFEVVSKGFIRENPYHYMWQLRAPAQLTP